MDEGATAVTMITRDEAAHRRFENALRRFRRAETELDISMDQLDDAMNAMRELRVSVDVEMKPSTSAAWVEHRAQRRRNASS